MASVKNGCGDVVKESQKDGETLFACEVCGFRYRDKATAEECQTYCETHSSCSGEITKKSIERGN